jgi:hypothetical protein
MKKTTLVHVKAILSFYWSASQNLDAWSRHKLPLWSGADFQPTSEATSSWSSRVCYSESSHVAWSFATTNIFWGNTLLQSTLLVVCTATYIYISCGMGYPHDILCHPGLRREPLHAIIFCILLVWISCNIHGFIMWHIKFATFGSVDFHNTKYFSCGKFRLQYTLWCYEYMDSHPPLQISNGNETRVPHASPCAAAPDYNAAAFNKTPRMILTSRWWSVHYHQACQDYPGYKGWLMSYLCQSVSFTPQECKIRQ